jgi:TPR repeat protein
MAQVGRGGDEDVAGAVTVYRETCDAGEGTGCYRLAYAHEHGIGVQKNSAEANRLYSKACGLGDKRGCSRLEK